VESGLARRGVAGLSDSVKLKLRTGLCGVCLSPNTPQDLIHYREESQVVGAT